MHIIIAALTALGGLAWALYRLQNSGLDLNAFNPFYWKRRRDWAKKLGTKPIHQLANPMEAAAALVVGAAHLDGVVTREQKNETVQIFCKEFQISNQAANELFSASTYLLKDVADITAEVKNILAPTLNQFKTNHTESLLNMLNQVSNIEGDASEQQIALIEAVKGQFVLASNGLVPEWQS